MPKSLTLGKRRRVEHNETEQCSTQSKANLTQHSSGETLQHSGADNHTQQTGETCSDNPTVVSLDHWQAQVNKSFDINFKSFSALEFSMRRIKNIMKIDEDVSVLTGEAPVLFSKACELFVLDLTIRSWCNTNKHNRRTIQRSDIVETINVCQMFDFLIDIVPPIIPGDTQHSDSCKNETARKLSSSTNPPSIYQCKNALPIRDVEQMNDETHNVNDTFRMMNSQSSIIHPQLHHQQTILQQSSPNVALESTHSKTTPTSNDARLLTSTDLQSTAEL